MKGKSTLIHQNRRHFGLDTETPMGKLKVIATNEEAIEASSFEEVMGFLTQRKYRGVIFWLFNQRYDCEHILKTTGDKDFLQDLYDNGARRPGIEYNGYQIQYIQGKLMKICKEGHCATFYDIAQFYRGAKLAEASRQYLPEKYWKDISSVSAQRLGEEEGYYENNKVATLKYCQQDALATLELAKLIENTFTSRGISFRSPISQAKISEVYVKDHCSYPQVPKGKVTEYHEFARAAFHGGLFWTLKRGYFHQPLYSFDINSAYPSVMATLPHWGNGEFKQLKEAEPLSDSKYGWYWCKFDCQWIPRFDFNPQTFDQEMNGYGWAKVEFNDKRKIYPTGIRTQWITKAEYQFMEDNHFYHEIVFPYGIEWVQNKTVHESPFLWMSKMYNERKEIEKKDKTGMLQYALKILLNGLYGKTCQRKKGIGKLTNFFYASYITAMTRIQVAEVALRHPKETIEIATDSVTLTKDISAELSVSKELGEWGLDTYAEGLFIGSGMRQEWYDRGDSVTYARGLTDKRDYDLRADLERNRDSVELIFSRRRPIHMGEMLVKKYMLKFEDLGVFMDVRKRLKVNTDTKSQWKRDYVNFGDFLDSKPMGGRPLEI